MQPSDKPMFVKCLDSARETVTVMITRLAPSGYMRYSPDGWFLIASFASAFLFKLLRPQFKALVSTAQETEILELVGRLIQTLSSPDIAIDDRHTPKVYARFLASLLSRHRREGVASFSLQINPPPARPVGSGPPSGAAANGFTMSVQPPEAPTSAGYQQPSFGGGYGMQQQQPQQHQQHQEHQQHQQHQHPSAMQTDDVFSALGLQPAQQQPFAYAGFGDDSWSDDGHASMAILQTPAWWDQMMLPGFSWPPSSPASAAGSFPAGGSSMPAPYPMQLGVQS
jgi:hypothetical protein